MLSLFKVPGLKKQIAELEKENEQLRSKLNSRQEQINKTNAYWKGIMRKMERAQKRP